MVVEIIIRFFFTVFHFVLLAIIENNLDFLKFRVLFNMSINMLMVTFSTEANPLQTILMNVVLTYPILNYI